MGACHLLASDLHLSLSFMHMRAPEAVLLLDFLIMASTFMHG
jgi:hypothetical protein